MRLRTLISTADVAREDLEQVLADARGSAADAAWRPLAGRTLAMAFLAESTRTRTSLEEACAGLGVEVRDLTATALTAPRGAEAAAYLARAAAESDALAIRHTLAPGRTDAFLRALAAESERPVINLQSSDDHPIQALADLLTLRAVRPGGVAGARIALVWAWQRTPTRPPSVPHGLAQLLPRFGAEVRIAHPPGFELSPAVLDRARTLAAEGGSVRLCASAEEAMAGADFIYPQGYAPDGLLQRPEDATALAAPFASWRFSEAAVAGCAEGARVLRSLPAADGEECATSLYEGPRGLFFAQTEGRRAIMRAVLRWAIPAGGAEP